MKKIILGNTELKSSVILAPMAGVTDLPFRRIAREFGDFLMFSEMIASQAVIRNVKRTHKMMDNADDELTSVQIVGADPIVMAEAAKLSLDLGARFIDINMGCPVKKIVRADAGSALMRNERLAASIIESVVNAVDIPVTLKMRLGWDMDHKNAHKIARIAEDLGIQMISVHGRTRSQLYSGTANWREVGLVKDSVNIPVIVNGDISTKDTARKAIDESGADGVMIGRGALGRPWFLRDLHNFLEKNDDLQNEISNAEKLNVATRHLRYIMEFYGESTGIKISRKCLMHYCKGTKNAAKYRQEIVSVNSINSAYDLLEAIFSK